MDATRSCGGVYGRQGRTIVVLFLVLRKTRSLLVEVKVFFLLLLLDLDLLIDLKILFVGGAPRATRHQSCAAQSEGWNGTNVSGEQLTGRMRLLRARLGQRDWARERALERAQCRLCRWNRICAFGGHGGRDAG
jgi:hypothetical protein